MIISRAGDGRIIDANDAYCRMIGVPREALIGSSGAELGFWCEIAERHALVDRARRDGGVRDVEIRQRKASGEILTLLVSIHPTVLEGHDCFMWSTIDITGRKATERALLESKAKLEAALASMADAVFISDTEGRFIEFNPAFASFHKFPDKESCKTTFAGFREILDVRLPDGSRAPISELAVPRALRGEIGTAVEYHLHRTDTGESWIGSYSFGPIRDPQGAIVGAVVSARDITERKRVERELERHRAHLEELVAERTRELAQAMATAQSASLAKSTFLANMSHEIRTPLNAIMGLAHLLRRSDMTDKQADQLAKIDRAARHLLGLIEDILDLSKIEAGKLVLEDGEIALAALPDSVAAMVADQARAKGLHCVVDAAALPASARGDQTRLTQALLNLVGNAVKFTERGSVRLTARVQEEDDSGLMVRFEVQDTGVGIPAEALDKLFRPFEQADASTTRRFGGTGLGLAISKRLVEMMGGEIGVSSTPGVGSTFWFTARVGRSRLNGRPPPTPMTAAADRLAAAHRGARVLLVEDDPVNQEVSVDLLEAAGMVVDVVDNGLAAVERIASGARYDAILMDMQMPILDGPEATCRIRALPGGRDVPVLAMTANAFTEDRHRCERAGMSDFVSKPVEPDVLYGCLLRWLGMPAFERTSR
jgi:two-component system, sensor histidine kinase and response regulator